MSDPQVALGALLLGLFVAFAAHLRMARSWCTGQTAFTGMWLIGALALLGLPGAWRYLTWSFVALALLAHFAFLSGSTTARRLAPARGVGPVFPSPSGARAIRLLYWSTLILGGLGVAGLLIATGAWQVVMGLNPALVRYVGLEVVEVPTIPRILSNFMLTPVALAPAMAVACGVRRPQVRFYIAPGLMLLGQSVAFGGRGGVIFGGLLLFWGLAIFATVRFFLGFDRRLLAILGALVVALLGYSLSIFIARQAVATVEGGGLLEYVGLPIAAGAEAMRLAPDQPVLALGLDSLAPARELLRLAGYSASSRIDQTVVFVPEAYNVFTSLVEHVQAFGYAGAVAFAWLLGLASGLLETGRQTLARAASRSLIYCYLGMSLFADLAFFYTGWSVALVAVALGPPLLERLLTPGPAGGASPDAAESC